MMLLKLAQVDEADEVDYRGYDHVRPQFLFVFFLPEEHLYSSKGPYSLLTVKAT